MTTSMIPLFSASVANSNHSERLVHLLSLDQHSNMPSLAGRLITAVPRVRLSMSSTYQMLYGPKLQCYTNNPSR